MTVVFLWINIPLMVLAFALWVGVPLWLVLRHPDRHPRAAVPAYLQEKVRKPATAKTRHWVPAYSVDWASVQTERQ